VFPVRYELKFIYYLDEIQSLKGNTIIIRNIKPTQDTHDQEVAHPMVHRAAAIQKIGRGDTI
jgi:hypothetical protein